MPTSVPVGVRALDVLILEFLLPTQPLLTELFALATLLLLAFTVGQKRRVNLGILPGLCLLHWWLVTTLRRVPALIPFVVVKRERQGGLGGLLALLHLLLIPKRVLHVR